MRIALLMTALFVPAVASAQTMIHSLPADGTWARLEGTFAQTLIRPETTEGKLVIAPWTERVWIKSVGQKAAEFQGKEVPCRWIEIKIERGRVREGRIDTGTAGLEIYKVLIPESVFAAGSEAAAVADTYIPIARGYRKVGGGDPVEIKEPVLQLFPLFAMVGYYRNWNLVDKGANPDVAIEGLVADRYEGEVTLERVNGRTTQQTSIWLCKTVPFGVAKVIGKTFRFQKDDRDVTGAFKPTVEIVEELKLLETGEGAESELSVQ